MFLYFIFILYIFFFFGHSDGLGLPVNMTICLKNKSSQLGHHSENLVSCSEYYAKFSGYLARSLYGGREV